MMRCIDQEVRFKGSVVDRVRVMTGQSELIAELPSYAADEDFAAVFALMRRMDGVHRSYRVGEVRRRQGAEVLRTAVVLELSGSRWWLATRDFRARASGVGAFEGPWAERSGCGLGLLGVLRAWVDPHPMAELTPTTSVPQIRAAFGELESVPPSDPYELARFVGALVAPALFDDVSCAVFSFTGKRFERWEVVGTLPCTADEFIRNVASLGRPDAVALVRTGIAPFDRAGRRALFTAVECAGVRCDRARILEGASQVHVRKRKISAARRWLGRAPSRDLGLHPLAPTSGLMPEG
jgi:hypothetical protein